MPGDDGLMGWYRGIRYLYSYTCLELCCMNIALDRIAEFCALET